MLRKIWIVSVLSVSAVASLLWVVGRVRSNPLVAPPVFTVNSTKDEVDATPGDGVCDSTPSGVCTLRAAIMEANRLTGTTILLPSGIYSLTIHWAGIDGEDSGDLNIQNSMVISGAGAATTIIDANSAVINDWGMTVGPTTSLVTISGVTIRGGHLVDYPAGAIDTDAALTLKDCVIRDNSSNGPGVAGVPL
jgi:CSLREA domain-containing protein